MMKKKHLKKEDSKRKREKRDNLNANEKRGQQKKKEKRDNLGDNEKEQLRKYK